jgi:hypothetical protein
VITALTGYQPIAALATAAATRDEHDMCFDLPTPLRFAAMYGHIAALAKSVKQVRCQHQSAVAPHSVTHDTRYCLDQLHGLA